MKIEVTKHEMEGAIYYFPFDKIAQLFCDFLKKKSLNKLNIGIIRQIGFDIRIVDIDGKLIEELKNFGYRNEN